MNPDLPTIYHSEAEIRIKDNEVTLWRLLGVPGILYPTKIAAEVAARARFPHEAPLTRYARISYIEVNLDDAECP